MMSAVLDGAVFPGTQGGPLEHVIAAKAVSFAEALDETFMKYFGDGFSMKSSRSMYSSREKGTLREPADGSSGLLMASISSIRPSG